MSLQFYHSEEATSTIHLYQFKCIQSNSSVFMPLTSTKAESFQRLEKYTSWALSSYIERRKPTPLIKTHKESLTCFKIVSIPPSKSYQLRGYST